ncbi:MAG: DHH family phosphoesterase [Deltaproteobacteria bacterium]|nr:DHH family phosphoesterase [Deltaproteobacteria bacterium]
MTIYATERLRRFFQSFKHDDHVLILINADPDALASALAVKRLLWRKVAGVTISHINVISRPDNLTMIRLLQIDSIYIEQIDKQAFNRFVIVDSQPNHHEIFGRFQIDVIIDHHPETGASAPFIDIRTHYGATATILTEYLRAARIKPSIRLATALFHAIKNDTDDFIRKTTIEDIQAFQYLYRFANRHLAQRMEQGDIRYDFLKYFDQAFHNRRVQKEQLIAHLGSVINPDVCVLIADFFIRIDTISWSIVSGIYDKKLIIIFRHTGFKKDAGKLAKRVFGQWGTAGGHKSIARAEIPLEKIKDLVDIKDDKAIQRWIGQKVKS